MKFAVALGLLAGLAATAILVLSHGAGAIWHSAAFLGAGGFAIVVCFHLGLIVLMGAAWWLLARGRADATLARFAWGRLIRDSASEALPLSQVGGFVLGARALAVAGISGAFAAASTVVDVTTELSAQLVYVVIGLVAITYLRPDNGFALPVLTGVVAMSLAVAAFVAVQARGAGFVERTGARLAREFLGRDLGQAGAVQAGIHGLHQKPARLALAVAIHLAAWLLNAAETWVTFQLMGIELGLLPALAIDSLLYGIRSVAFMVPNAFGVQEGGLVLLGGLFGVAADAALAVSLIKRARDLAIGVPALLLWQAIEGRQAWRRRGLLDVAGHAPPASSRSSR